MTVLDTIESLPLWLWFISSLLMLFWGVYLTIHVNAQLSNLPDGKQGFALMAPDAAAWFLRRMALGAALAFLGFFCSMICVTFMVLDFMRG